MSTPNFNEEYILLDSARAKFWGASSTKGLVLSYLQKGHFNKQLQPLIPVPYQHCRIEILHICDGLVGDVFVFLKTIDFLNVVTSVPYLSQSQTLALKKDDLLLSLFYCKSSGSIYLLPFNDRTFKKVDDGKQKRRAAKGYVLSSKGKEIKKSNAVKLYTCWFEKGVDVLEFDSTWVINSNSVIAPDHTTGKNNLIHNMILLLKEFDEKGTPQFAYFSVTQKKFDKIVNLSLPDGRVVKCINVAFAAKLGYIENVQTGYFYPSDHGIHKTKNRPTSTFHEFSHIKNKIVSLTKLGDELKKKVINYNFSYGTDSPTNLITENKPYSFGVELETSRGVVPSHVYSDWNAKCTRDGSVTGGEYVTGILYGDCGFMMLKKICQQLIKRCEVDNRCGLHVHIGGADFTKEFNVFLYILCHMVEKDIFNMLPKDRAENPYCSKLTMTDWLDASLLKKLIYGTTSTEEYHDVIGKLYSNLFEYLAREKPSRTLNKKYGHPGGHYAFGHGTARYNWVNTITCNFKQRSGLSVTIPTVLDEDDQVVVNDVNAPVSVAYGEEPLLSYRRRSDVTDALRTEDIAQLRKHSSLYTVEFRNHSGTLSFTKVKNWLLICMGLVYFVENRKTFIVEALKNRTNITLIDVITEAYSEKKAADLLKYIKDRTVLFAKDFSEDMSISTKDEVTSDSVLNLVKQT